EGPARGGGAAPVLSPSLRPGRGIVVGPPPLGEPPIPDDVDPFRRERRFQRREPIHGAGPDHDERSRLERGPRLDHGSSSPSTVPRVPRRRQHDAPWYNERGMAIFTGRTERAIALAVRAHDTQVRKGDPQLPYIVHPVTVALILSRYTTDED